MHSFLSSWISSVCNVGPGRIQIQRLARETDGRFANVRTELLEKVDIERRPVRMGIKQYIDTVFTGMEVGDGSPQPSSEEETNSESESEISFSGSSRSGSFTGSGSYSGSASGPGSESDSGSGTGSGSGQGLGGIGFWSGSGDRAGASARALQALKHCNC